MAKSLIYTSTLSLCRLRQWYSAVAVVAGLIVCAFPALALDAPAINPNSGSFATQQSVTMSAASGTIFYTLDGSTPTISSTEYVSSFTLTKPTTVKAVAHSAGTYSSITTAYLDISPKLAPVLQSGLILRLRAGLGVETSIGSPARVSKWLDLSGSGNNASASGGDEPILKDFAINNLPAVSFNGSSQFLSFPSGFADFTGGVTMFMVVQPTTLTNSERIIDFGDGASGDNILFRLADASSTAQFWTYNGTSGTAADSVSALAQNKSQLLSAVQTGNAGTFYLNGIPGTTNNSMSTIPDTTRSSNFLARSSSGSNYFGGNIAEVLVYSTALTTAQRTAIEAYLMQRYQILSVVPSTPKISVPSGTLSGPTQVVIATDSGTTTFITTDGSTPTASSTPYFGCPIHIQYSQTLKAISYKNGLASGVASATYELDPDQWPAPDPGDTTAPTINLELPTATQ